MTQFNDNEFPEVKVGGEQKPRKMLPSTNEDGTPRLYPVVVRGMRKKQGKPNDQGQETFYFSWRFEVIDGEHKGEMVFGSTNDEARRTYTTKKPMKLLQLIMAIEGKEPAKGTTLNLKDLMGKPLRVELEDKQGADGEPFQTVLRYYPFKGAVAAQPDAKEELPVVQYDEKVKDTDEANEMPF